MIELKDVNFKYKNGDMVLKDINLKIEEKEFITVIGKNGSGKSTLLKLIGGITKPTKGQATVDGIDLKDKKNFMEIRKKVGIVFQNPENQIIFNNVHDDIAFGIKNLGLDNLENRIKEALKTVNMKEHENREAYDLSMGQKQRITIASVLSMGTKYLVMDEPTAMLDSEGKETVYEIVKKLKQQGYTIIYATNVMDEILYSDKVIIMEKGEIVKSFKPTEILENIQYLKDRNIQIPPKIQTLLKLQEKGIDIQLKDLM